MCEIAAAALVACNRHDGPRRQAEEDCLFLETNAAATVIAGRSISDEDDPGTIQRADKLHQRVHIAADNAITGFHPLNGRQREPRFFGKLPLIDLGKCSSGSQLRSCNHGTQTVVMNFAVW